MDREKLREYIEYVLKGLVDNPESLSVSLTEAKKNFVITVSLKSSDVGQIIGKKAVTVHALETVFWAAGRGKGNLIEFVEIDKPEQS